jgi:hypothetical protein
MSDEQQRLIAYEWERAQRRVLFSVKQEYSWAIKNGIAKEQARAVLPEGLTISRMYMNGTLRHGFITLNYVRPMVHKKNTWKLHELVLRLSQQSFQWQPTWLLKTNPHAILVYGNNYRHKTHTLESRRSKNHRRSSCAVS